MKRLLSVIFVFGLISSAIIFTSCDKETPKVSFVKANYPSQCVFSKNENGYKNSNTAYEIVSDVFSDTSIDFKYSGATAGKLYQVSCYVFVENYSVENSDGKNVVIATNLKDDINSKTVYSNSVKSNTYDTENNRDGWVKLKKIVKADSKDINFSVVFGWKDNKSIGDFYVDKVDVKKVSKLSTYKVVKSKDKTVEMLFYKSDLEKYCNNQSKLNDYVNCISRFRGKLVNLVGDDFTDKSTFLFTETQSKFGYAGAPIYISRKSVSDVLKSIDDFNKKNLSEYTYGLLHEMSHTFDRICGNSIDKRWLFDSEFWADFKVACMLENHYKIKNQKVINYYEDDYLSNGIYTSEALVKYYLKDMEKSFSVNYKGLSETLKTINKIEKEKIPNSNYDRFSLFNDTFKNNSDVDLEKILSHKQWETIALYMKDT
mgnify:CR=1 FL=1